MDVQAYLAERARLVDASLERCVPPADARPRALHAAMRHLLFPGGKRLRPALAFAAAEAVGAAPERALPVATAVELVHTYSLVHDDLPCMDDDDERRGRPTVHVAFGEATAVLAGDALLALAFETLAAAGAEHAAERVLASLRDLARAAGSHELVGGQAEDLAFGASGADAAGVESVHRRKTAALFGAAAVGAARLAGADEESLARLARFAACLGVAFQISDDVRDGAADRPAGCSLVAVLGEAGARQRAARLLEQSLEVLEPFGAAAEPLRELARFAVEQAR